MLEALKTLLFCDDCSCLALAELEGEILCTDCLLKRVARPGPHPNEPPEQGSPIHLIVPLEDSEEARFISMAS